MITLGKLKEMFDAYADDHVFEYGLGDVFSWRGSYDEPCFSIEQNVTAKHCKRVVEEALNESFMGWKGGEYSYYEGSPVNFEREEGVWSDGRYLAEKLEEMLETADEDTMLFWLKINKG